MLLQNVEKILERAFDDRLVLLSRPDERPTTDLALDDEIVRLHEQVVRGLQILVERQQHTAFSNAAS